MKKRIAIILLLCLLCQCFASCEEEGPSEHSTQEKRGVTTFTEGTANPIVPGANTQTTDISTLPTTTSAPNNDTTTMPSQTADTENVTTGVLEQSTGPIESATESPEQTMEPLDISSSQTEPVQTQPLIPGHVHSYVAAWKNDDTAHWYECSCGEKKDRSAHSFGEWIVDQEANCTASGSRHHVCSVCGKSVSETIPAKGHTIVIDLGVDATCTVDGLTEGRHCSVCNTVLKAQEKVNALGHDFVEGLCTRCRKVERYSEGLAFEKSSDNQSWIVCGLGTCRDEAIFIPTEYENLAVTGIGVEAFANCTTVNRIWISDSIQTIGERAFLGCSGMHEITIPATVTEIGAEIFKQSNIKTVYYYSSSWHYPDFVNFMEGVTKAVLGCKVIPLYLFENNTTLTDVEILDTVSTIGSYAFENCVNLKNVSIANGLKTISWDAFCNCKSLECIVIPDSVTTIDGFAFDGCSSLSQISFSENVTEWGGGVFRGCGFTSFTIPDNMTKIPHVFFSNCYHLTSITIPDTVTSIGPDAFCDCGNLEEISIPSGVTEIGRNAFKYCGKLTSITIPAGVTTIESSVFYDCIGLTHITIPAGVTSIEPGAFGGCTGLESISIPESVTEIGDYVFAGCKGLKNIHIPSGVTVIGERLFERCTMLTNIILPENVTSIGDETFRDCTALTDITIPKTVISFGRRMLGGSSKLERITFQGTISEWRAITKWENWYYDSGNFIVICLDGTLSKTQSIE